MKKNCAICKGPHHVEILEDGEGQRKHACRCAKCRIRTGKPLTLAELRTPISEAFEPMLRALVACQVAMLDLAITDVRDTDKAMEHLKDLDVCLEHANKIFNGMRYGE